MRRYILLLCIIFCGLSATAQETTIESSRPVKVFLSNFTSIHVDAPIKLKLTKIAKDEPSYIIYDTKGIYTSKFVAEVDSKNSTLKISERSDSKRTSITEVEVYFSSLNDISISKADVTVDGILDSQLLDIYISNDALFVSEINVMDLMIFAAGKSRIILSGTARYQTADISTAEYDAGQLNTTSTIAEASHNAVVKLNATERLEAKTSTGGKVYYVVQPVILRSEVTLFGGEIVKL